MYHAYGRVIGTQSIGQHNEWAWSVLVEDRRYFSVTGEQAEYSNIKKYVAIYSFETTL